MIQKLPTIEHKGLLFCNIALHCNIVFVMEELYTFWGTVKVAVGSFKVGAGVES